MQRVLIVGILWVVACGPQPEICNMGGGTGGGFGGSDSPAPPFNPDAGLGGAGGGPAFSMRKVGLAGQPMEVVLAQGQLVTCGPGSKVVEVFTEVFDPQNRPVEHTRTALPGFSTTITFTPTEPGDYHLSARFEPSLGTSQVDVIVARDLTNAVGTALKTDTPCRSLEVMPSGLVLCQTPSSLRVFRDGAVVQTFDSDEFALAGDVVWVSRIGAVKRFVDVGGATPLGNVMAFDTMITDTALKLIATPDKLLAVGAGGGVRLAVVNNALVEEKRTAKYVGPGSTVTAQPDLNKFLFWETTGFNEGKLCRYDVNAGLDQGCVDIGRSEVMGADASGHWSHSDFVLRVDSLDPNGIIQTATLAFPGLPITGLPFTATHLQTSPFIPTDFGFHLAPRLTPTGIILDAFKLPAGFLPKGGTTTALRIEHTDGRQLFFAR